MIKNIILASQSGVRKKLLEENGINCEIIPANINEELIKKSLLEENANPELISKNLEIRRYVPINRFGALIVPWESAPASKL